MLAKKQCAGVLRWRLEKDALAGALLAASAAAKMALSGAPLAAIAAAKMALSGAPLAADAVAKKTRTGAPLAAMCAKVALRALRWPLCGGKGGSVLLREARLRSKEPNQKAKKTTTTCESNNNKTNTPTRIFHSSYQVLTH
ncbi:uncharacterized protein LOC133848896 [Drosophila sulfurigaster albostrigata]|uniref:uncharacterized protein LOC133848896 n=1 Tax=Drosophila sulfurigaster albostrigata TaxID=89887 RepID=UPI002D21E552|nr:uncharacterized protein LOC133848896 [Drosophila sulfurigaster albostrigata]